MDMGDAESVGGTWGIGAGEMLMERVSSAFENANMGGLRQAVVAALVDLHQIAKATAEEVAAEVSSISRTFLSPRDYLTLIQNFVSSLNTRREEVEDQQLHVNAGLEKLRQTQENVAELKQSLGAKTVVLREKESLANEKLQQMVADQNVAEKRKVEAEKMSAEVKKQQVEIDKRKDEAQRDLDGAEPALREAQASVRGIKKRDLDEVRNLARPPNNVKLTLECIAMMMGERKLEWTDVRKLLSKSEFIPSILNFDADKMSEKQIKMVREKYLDGNKELTAEAVMRSSKACGPLYKWAESQIKYSSVYNRIQPLRDEVEQLEGEAKVVKEQFETITQEVKTLETSIAQYKADYATLIRDVEALKSEMDAAQTKIERAESLLKSLGHESERWQKSSEGFQTILRSLVGDGLLMAAFLTYTGFFDFKTRLLLMERWRNTLDVLGIEYRSELALVESLSKASARLAWQAEGLPGDQLSLENGVILDHCVRFPLVIDPSGSAINFLLKKHQNEKIQRTSFLDKAFMKTLAGAVRFGTALLVENVEHIDPILNPLLNRELQRTGGRTLVRIGTEEIDFSPKFRIILSTKNPAVQLTPDVCSRVTLVNFTVTPASLQSQSMSQVVRCEKPELETQRASLLKLQGEQNVKLRELEDQMLEKISACEGSILDDDQVVSGMEKLMKEGSQVEEQIAKSEEVIQQVHTAVSRFEPFAILCRKLFVLLGALRDINFLYEFSANSFMHILDDVLKSSERSGSEDEIQRIGSLKSALFRELSARIARGLKGEDKLVFAILLARLFTSDESIGAKEVLSSEDLIAELQPLGANFPWQGRGLNEIAAVTENELSPTSPLLLCSAPGYDVSGRVDAMARELSKELASVAMGSAEGYETADKLVSMAAKRGTWVMLKNCHLCTDWLRETFIKKLQSLGSNTHRDFRLFITSEINPKLPTALLRISDIMVAEATTGIQASMTRFFSSISKTRLDNNVKNRLYLLLAWVHAVIQERLRYFPSGWTVKYEFSESDAIHGLDVIDSLIKDMGGDKTTLDPAKLPFDALRSTLKKGVFGGRVTQAVDEEVLDKLVSKVFVEDSFGVDFKLVEPDGPTMPDGTSKDQCFAWIASLPSHTPPAWVGLGSDAETELEMRKAKSITDNIKKVAAKEDHE